MRKKIIGFFVVVLFHAKGLGQDYALPIETFHSFSTGFGELRSNHFHVGVDSRTNARVGLPVFAVADGYIAQIRVSGTGYGNCLFLQHYDGRVSVYAHLNHFATFIADYVEKEQIQQKKQEVLLALKKDEIPVVKGNIIGYSGNSGLSTGPHLHFEIRDTSSKIYYNPLTLYPLQKDKHQPTIKAISITRFNSQNIPVGTEKYDIKTKKGQHYLQKNITVSGKIGISIEAHDRYNSTSFLIEPYSLKLFTDGELRYEVTFDSLTLWQKKVIRGNMNFSLYVSHNVRHLNLYENENITSSIGTVQNGRIEIDKETPVKIEVCDLQKNCSELSFNISPLENPPIDAKFPEDEIFYPNTFSNTIKRDDFSVYFPTNSLLNTSHIKTEVEHLPNRLKKIIIGKQSIPIGTPFVLKINISEDFNPAMKEKLYIAHVVEAQKKYIWGSEHRNNSIIATYDQLGTFEIAADTIPPKIFKTVNEDKTVLFSFRDEQTGVKEYQVFSDNEWKLCDVVGNHQLLCHFMELDGSGKTIRATATDVFNNSTEIQFYLP